MPEVIASESPQHKVVRETQDMQKKDNRKWLVLFVVVILLLIAAYFMFSNAQSGTSWSGSQSTKRGVISPNPTPFPFQELTVPYLRNRTYESKIGKLHNATETSAYTGYLTSYVSDGLTVNGYLTVPKGDRPPQGWSAIVFVHGYIPPASYRTLENYSEYVDYLARNGFVVFKIDLRGHGSSEGEPGGGYYSSDYVVDTLSAHTALQSLEFVNPQKIGLWGHSMAGNVVARSLAAKPDIPAVVVWAGAGYSYDDLRKYRIQDNSYQPPADDSERQRRRDELFNTHGQFSPDSEFWRQVAPTNYLSDIKGAIQLHHAVNDDVVDIGYSRDFNARLSETSVIHELKEYQSGGHNISGEAFTQAMQNTVEFFERYLKN